MLPATFKQQLKAIKGLDVERLCNVIEQADPVTSIRVHPHKSASLDFKTQDVPWCTTGAYLDRRPLFTTDPLLHAGAYYVQEASSMVLEQYIKQLKLHERPLMVLDLCAAPGGKSTHLLSLLHPDSLLVSNEVIKARNNVLQENLARWGSLNFVVSCSDASVFGQLGPLFDVVLVDAPCSGEGMFRKDPDAISEWSVEHVQLCSQRQQRIVDDILPCIKPGGILLYSTCTYEMSENEEVIHTLIQKYGSEPLNSQIQMPNAWGVESSELGFRLYPHQLRGEGLFISALRIPEQFIQSGKARVKPIFTLLAPKHCKPLASFVEATVPLSYFSQNEQCYAIHEKHADRVNRLMNHIFITHIGTGIGQLMKNTLVPMHYAALSYLLKLPYPDVPLSLNVAQQFLKKADLAKFDEVAQLNDGWYRVTYKGLGLGWIKKINHRTNNYYPKEMRILRDF